MLKRPTLKILTPLIGLTTFLFCAALEARERHKHKESGYTMPVRYKGQTTVHHVKAQEPAPRTQVQTTKKKKMPSPLRIMRGLLPKAKTRKAPNSYLIRNKSESKRVLRGFTTRPKAHQRTPKTKLVKVKKVYAKPKTMATTVVKAKAATKVPVQKKKVIPVTPPPPAAPVRKLPAFKVGESLLISLWGQPDMSMIRRVAKNHQISVPLAGKVSTKDINPVDLEREIESRFSRYFDAPIVLAQRRSANPRHFILIAHNHTPEIITQAGRVTNLIQKALDKSSAGIVHLFKSFSDRKPRRVSKGHLSKLDLKAFRIGVISASTPDPNWIKSQIHELEYQLLHPKFKK